MEADAHESRSERAKEVDRIAAFSDGVFAIAITLLSLQLAVPAAKDLGHSLVDLAPNVFAFVLSFLVIGAFWAAHHRLFALVRKHDDRLIWLNMAVLFFIVVIPFTTTVIASHGGSRLGVLVYAFSLVGAGVANVALTAYVLVGRRMCAPSVPDATVRCSLWLAATSPIVFLSSLLLLLLPIAPANVTLAWLTIPVVHRLLKWHYRGGASRRAAGRASA
jgi:uncharacterized membrane protein